MWLLTLELIQYPLGAEGEEGNSLATRPFCSGDLILMLFLFQSEPIELVKEFGPSAGAVILCAGLFIWNTIQMNGVSSKLDINTKAIQDGNAAMKEGNSELKANLEAQVQAQRELAQSVHQLAESIHHQAEVAAEELGLVREMATKQDVLISSQNSIMVNFQSILQQLITVLGGSKK